MRIATVGTAGEFAVRSPPQVPESVSFGVYTLFSNGFPEQVWCKSLLWKHCGWEVVRAHPIRRAYLTNWVPEHTNWVPEYFMRLPPAVADEDDTPDLSRRRTARAWGMRLSTGPKMPADDWDDDPGAYGDHSASARHLLPSALFVLLCGYDEATTHTRLYYGGQTSRSALVAAEEALASAAVAWAWEGQANPVPGRRAAGFWFENENPG